MGGGIFIRAIKGKYEVFPLQLSSALDVVEVDIMFSILDKGDDDIFSIE